MAEKKSRPKTRALSAYYYGWQIGSGDGYTPEGSMDLIEFIGDSPQAAVEAEMDMQQTYFSDGDEIRYLLVDSNKKVHVVTANVRTEKVYHFDMEVESGS